MSNNLLLLFVVRDGTPTDDELEELGNEIVEWNKLGRRLEVDEAKLAELSQAHDQLSEKAYHMLRHWKQGKGASATYKTLCNALEHKLVQRQDLAERFCYINGKYFLLMVIVMTYFRSSRLDGVIVVFLDNKIYSWSTTCLCLGVN